VRPGKSRRNIAERDIEAVRGAGQECGHIGKRKRPGVAVRVVVKEPAELATKF
jgi:hypothetical protein